jgi:tRNA1Val (adenine37-N6)-methyltransferase
MGNPYFRFKQFEIRQDRCAMPVTTEACMFGAWLAQVSMPVSHALDIGCGTGLLMGMVAQQWHGDFTGIEIDGEAAQQAAENMAKTPWAERIRVVKGDVRAHQFPHRFDVIFSNPPFYEGQLESHAGRINLARHGSGLSLEAFADAVAGHLAPGGYAATLLPPDRSETWLVLAGMRNLRIVQRTDLRQTPGHQVFRTMLLLKEGYTEAPSASEISIRDEVGNYSVEATALLKPYYLYL